MCESAVTMYASPAVFPVDGKSPVVATAPLTLIEVPCGPVYPVGPVGPVTVEAAPVAPVGPVGPV